MAANLNRDGIFLSLILTPERGKGLVFSFMGKFRRCLLLCLIPEVFTQHLRKIRKAPAKAKGEILPMSIPEWALAGKSCLPLCTNCQRKLLLFHPNIISSLQKIQFSHKPGWLFKTKLPLHLCCFRSKMLTPTADAGFESCLVSLVHLVFCLFFFLWALDRGKSAM